MLLRKIDTYRNNIRHGRLVPGLIGSDSTMECMQGVDTFTPSPRRTPEVPYRLSFGGRQMDLTVLSPK